MQVHVTAVRTHARVRDVGLPALAHVTVLSRRHLFSPELAPFLDMFNAVASPVWLSRAALLPVLVLSAMPRIAGQSCTSHNSCSASFYCDSGMTCYTCTYITPTTCDAFDDDCCSPAFLAQCTTNPAACPPAPPGPGPNPDNPDEEQTGDNGWTITILLLVSFTIYVLGGVGYVRYIAKKEDSGQPLLHSHPHYEAWQQLPGLVSDGYIYFRSVIGHPVDGGVISNDRQSSESFEEVPQTETSRGTTIEGTPPTSKKKKKQKTKMKPNPKGVRPSDAAPLLDVDVDSGSPQAPVE